MLHLGGVGDQAHLRGTPLVPDTPMPTGKLDDLILMLALAKADELQAHLRRRVRTPLLPMRPSDTLSRLARWR